MSYFCCVKTIFDYIYEQFFHIIHYQIIFNKYFISKINIMSDYSLDLKVIAYRK
jgi:hypothetical protein